MTWQIVILISIIWICTTVVILATNNIEIIIATFLSTVAILGLSFINKVGENDDTKRKTR